MGTERPNLDGEVHGDRSRMPPRSRETLEYRFCGSGVVQMHRLRIIFRSETFDVGFGDLYVSALETHPQRKVVEPLDHHVLLFKRICIGWSDGNE
jgi:hypothetical protein